MNFNSATQQNSINQQLGAVPSSLCQKCSLNDITSCIDCINEFLVKEASYVGINLFLGLLAIMGIYYMFKSPIDRAVSSGVSAAKHAGEAAAIA